MPALASVLGTAAPQRQVWLVPRGLTFTSVLPASTALDVSLLMKQPSGVIDGLGQHTAGQSFDIQILDRDDPVADSPVSERPYAESLFVGSSRWHAPFGAPERLCGDSFPRVPPCHTALRYAHLACALLVVARVANFVPSASVAKAFNPTSIPVRVSVSGNGCPNLDTEADIPFATLSLDRDYLDRAINGTMQMTLNVPTPCRYSRLLSDDIHRHSWERCSCRSAGAI